MACRVLGEALFDVDTVSGGGGGMVMVRDIEFASTSSANLLPFHGRCHIAYLPARGVVLGLSKFARLTALFARRFQDQQEFTDLVSNRLPGWIDLVVNSCAAGVSIGGHCSKAPRISRSLHCGGAPRLVASNGSF